MKNSSRANVFTGYKALVFGCPHAMPNEHPDDFDRFIAIGKMGLDFRTDAVICTGDLADYPSARSWNTPKRSENQRVFLDRKAGIDAAKAIMHAQKVQNEKNRRARHKERDWTPPYLLAMGNHDIGEDEIVSQDPRLEGLLGSHHIVNAWEEMGWNVWDYKSQVYDLEFPEIKGTWFGHFYPSGTMGKACSIKNVLSKSHNSIVFSHTGIWGYDQQSRGRQAIQALNIGVFQPNWRLKPHEWSGAAILSEMQNGEFMVHQFSYDWILREYGEAGYAKKLRTQAAQASQDREDASHAYA